MSSRTGEPGTGGRAMLAALFAASLIVGLTLFRDAATAWRDDAESVRLASTGPACRVCGIVYDVRMVDPAARRDISTVAGGSLQTIAALLGAISGGMTLHRAATYEVAVHMSDGSVRVLQSNTPPAWKQGDHVKIMKGRIEGA